MPNINEKAVTSWFRHIKSSAATALITPLVLASVKEFQKQGFTIGFNLPTAIVLGISVAIGTITVVGGILLKKRPDLSKQITALENKAVAELKTIATQEIATQTPAK